MDSTSDGHGGRYLPGMGHDRLLPFYDPLCGLLGIASFHRPLVEQAGIRRGHRVLELGCGTGNLTLMVKRLHPGAVVVGIDPDPKALERAGRKAGRGALPVRLDRGFAEELPYPDASIDRVLSAFMFHHLGSEEKEGALREARRVLKPGGSLHLLDVGGKRERSDGLVARMSHRNRMLQDNFGGRIPALMREAGLADPTEVSHRVTRLTGRVTYYRATAPATKPSAGSGAGQPVSAHLSGPRGGGVDGRDHGPSRGGDIDHRYEELP